MKKAGFDGAIDYKSENVAERLAAFCPNGIDVFFDNVGGGILEAALAQLARHARVVICGAISGYNEAEPPPGPRNYMMLTLQHARMEGFIVTEYFDRMAEGVGALLGWAAEGKLVYEEDIQEGFENIFPTFLRLFDGSNFGKQLLKLADPT